MNYYELLGVSSAFTDLDLKRAYKRAVMKYHPDVTRTQKTEEVFKEVLIAYQTLRDPMGRIKYDRQLKFATSGTDQSSVEPGYDPVTFFKHFYFNIRFHFVKVELSPEFGKQAPSVDKLLLKMDDEELKKKMLLSNNVYVQINAANALRLKNNKKSVGKLLSGLFADNENLSMHILKLLGGVKLKACLIQILRSFPASSTAVRKEIVAILKNFDDDLIKYLLSIYVPKEEPSCKAVALEVGYWL